MINYSQCSCTIFVLISYSLYTTQVMLTLLLSNGQYSQKAVFSFEKGWNGQITPPQVPITQ